MPDARITASGTTGGAVRIPGSKSESNRLLVLQALFLGIEIHNLSDSDDTRTMQAALTKASGLIDIGHAGTAMRFLTAYFAATPGDEVILTGSQRMRERPIGILVDALRGLGADIRYLDREGFPPLQIKRNGMSGNEISIDAGISSQYITALMLIAPALPSGLQIRLTGAVASAPYLEMTLALLQQVGVDCRRSGDIIEVKPAAGLKAGVTVESDWSSASYFYSIAALSPIGTKITLSTFLRDSIQGDRAVAEIFSKFGVETHFADGDIEITKNGDGPASFTFDFSGNPDLAQTLAVTCAGLSIPFAFTGLSTLRIKETDRILALATELERLGGKATIVGDDLHFEPAALIPGVPVKTYGDHRMALAFSALAARMPIVIEEFEVVGKSFLKYASALEKIGVEVLFCPSAT